MMCATVCEDCVPIEQGRRPLRWLLVLLSWSLVMAAGTSTALAAGDPDQMLDRLTPEDEARVIELIDEGEEAFADGNYRQALRIYHRLYGFFPHPDVNYRVATCYERLDEPERAIQHYIHFLEGFPDAEERSEVEARIARLQEAIGPDPSGVRVETFPIGSQIYIDDRETAPVGETPSTVQLPPGDYEVIVHQSGYVEERKSVTVREGPIDVVQFRLESDGGEVQQRRSRGADSRGTDHRWMPITAVMMAGMGGFALHQSSGYRSEYRDLGEGHPDYDNTRSQSIQFGVVGAGLVTGAVVFTTWFILRNRSPDVGERAHRGIQVDPSTDGVNIGVFSRF